MGENAGPKLGDIVIYHVDGGDSPDIKNNHAGELPAIVLAVWTPECVNLQVFCDGPAGTSWETSVMFGNGPGNWRFKV